MSTIPPAKIENTLIRASAGSGKTTALASRYLQLLARGVHCQNILATTFTRKAAGEILDRIMAGLAVASLHQHEARELGAKLHLPAFDQDAARPMLRHLLSNLHRLQIGTLDSFFANLARSFSLEIGLIPDWKIAEDRILEQVADAAVGHVLSAGDTVQLLHLMAQGASIRAAHQLMMDTVNKLYAIYQNSNPGAWFQFQSHPSPSAAQVRSAVEQLADFPIEDKRMAKARTEDVERAANEDWDSFIEKGLTGKIIEGSNVFYGKPIPEELRTRYLPLIDHVRGLVTTQLKAATESTFGLLDRFSSLYEAAKLDAGLMSFDDVTRRLVELMDSADGQTDAGWTYRLDWTVDHLLLDEFQDTSPAQWRVMEPFAQRVMKPDSQRSFFCVGDQKQAIYGWRGGVAEVFDLVERQFPGLNQLQLTRSHRSSQPITDTVNRVFRNADRYESKNPQTNAALREWKNRFTEHTTAKSEVPGYVVMERIDDESFAPVVERVQAIYERSPGRTIAILTRNNDEVKKLIFELQSKKIPASEEGGNPLTDAASVLLILSLVKLSDHPHDSIAWFHVFNSPLGAVYGLPACEIDHQKSPQALRQIHAIAATIRRDLCQQGYGAMIARWAAVLAPSCTARELRRLQKLIELADQYDAEATLRPSDFGEFVRQQKVEDPTGAAVRVMTVHKAKGLEFDIVVLPCLSNRFNPISRDIIYWRPSPTDKISFVSRYANAAKRPLLPPMIQQAHDQEFERGMTEEICVMYVALTRAARALHLFVGDSVTPSHQSLAGILLATLSEEADSKSKAHGTLYECGDPNWAAIEGPADPERTSRKLAEPSQAQADLPRQRLTLAAAADTGRGLATLSPSQLTTSRREKLSDLLARTDHVAAIDRGTLLHACFATVEWLDEAPWQNALLTELHKRFPGEPSLDSVIQEFTQLVGQPTISALLRRATYAEQTARRIFPNQIIFEPLSASVANERRFAVRLDQAIVQGTIDRLVTIREGQSLIGAEVIEYKTDRLFAADEAAIESRVAEYRPQIQTYRRAAAQFTGLALNKVLARLILVGIDREFEVR